MTEITLAIFDSTTGTVLVDTENARVAEVVEEALTPTLGKPVQMGCALPTAVLQLPHLRHVGPARSDIPRIAGIWHNSHVEGPGRRSVVQFQGCPIRCAGCWVPQTHDPDAGFSVSADLLAGALLDRSYQRDGVTILGGEPFAQPLALDTLIRTLRRRQPDLNIAVYTGFTLTQLTRRIKFAAVNPIEANILENIDLLIDGPYVKSRAHSDTCGCDDETRRWTGSCNQRIHDLRLSNDRR